MPRICPSCNAPVTRDEAQAAFRCNNPDCPAQRARQIEHFASKAAMNIEGLGPQVVDLLLREKRIENAADLYYLKEEDIENLERMGKKSAQKLISSIERSKDAGLERFLFSLGIRQVGSVAAAAIAQHFGSMEAVMAADEEALCSVSDIGLITASCITEYFGKPGRAQYIERFRCAGVGMTPVNVRTGKRFEGLTFVLTGTLPTLTRQEAARLITEQGGKVSGSVSKKTSYVVAGSDAGSKLSEANRLNIPVVDEQKLKEMLS